MRKPGREFVTMLSLIDPDLQRKWEQAIATRPDDDLVALEAWNGDNRELMEEYQAATAAAKSTLEANREEQRQRQIAKIRHRWKIAATITAILLVLGLVAGLVCGSIYWFNQPSADQVEQQHNEQLDTACTIHYEHTYHIRIVYKQIDLLKDGEGGWVNVYTYDNSETLIVGSVTLSPSELLSGKTGTAQINHEGYVHDDAFDTGVNGLLERIDGKLVLTIFAVDQSGFGDLPHAPIQAGTASTATVRGELLSRACTG